MKTTVLAITANMIGLAAPMHAQTAMPDTAPAAVVQRFVDAANARNLDNMMATVASQAIFGSLPDNGMAATGRDSVRAQYARILGRLPAGYTIKVASRIADGAFVTDLEHFANADGTPAGRATWVYHVTGGQIQRAWVLRQSGAARPPVSAQAPVPMHQEPRHRLVLTHQQVRVMDVKIRSGDTTLFHVHDVPALFVAVSTAPVDIQPMNGAWGGTHPAADPGRNPGDVNVDTSYVRQPITHRVTNVGAQLFNLIAITSSTVSPGDTGAHEMPGAIEVENRWFTQSRARLNARMARRWYTASSPTIVVQPLSGSAIVLLQSGDKQALNTPGSWALIPKGTRYQLSSPSSATLVVVQIR